MSHDMVEKALERDSDDAMVGLRTERLKHSIVRITIHKKIREPEF